MSREVAVVSGGGGHIGHYISLKLAAQGVIVAVCDINTETAQKVVDEITAAGGQAAAYAVDVKDPHNVNRTMDTIIQEHGKVDILVTAAGGSARKNIKQLADQTDEVIRDVIDLNLFGSIYCARAAARHMIDKQTGRIIFIGSTIGVQGRARCVEYSASKGAVLSMTKSLAMELGQYGITVNCVSPGLVRRPDETYDASHTNYLGRNGTAEDVANMIAFLTSDEASFITGQNHLVDGGRSLGLKGSE